MEYTKTGFFTAADGTRIFYGLRGDSTELPPVVLCDGIGCDGFVWRYLQPHLAQHRQVVHWNYRSHGRSGLAGPGTLTLSSDAEPAQTPRVAHTDSMNIPQFASDLEGLLAHLNLGSDQVIIAGHSMGTLVAIEWARQHAERCASLVLLNGSSGRITHSFRGTDSLHELVTSLLRYSAENSGLFRALWSGVSPKMAFRLAKLTGDVDPSTIRPEDFVTYWKHVTDMDPVLFLHLLHAAGVYDGDAFLNELTMPALVIAAEHDTFTPKKRAKELAENLGNAEYFQIRGGSHAAPVEQPETVSLRVDKFLSEQQRASQAPRHAISKGETPGRESTAT